MDLKLTGVVKQGGKWRKPGDVIRKVDDEIAQELIAACVAEETEAGTDDDAELKGLRERAKALGVSNAGRLGEAKLKESITERETELEKLRTEVTELGIEGANSKTFEELITDIANAKKK
ncbi:hypothetical protein J2Z22_001591 [Paenibacillus forsythiae]|uniref:Uncharacterized protein n=1 Tax=Paenibacillus forsythiae TaxID=365616 RepID=A0ABU3H5H6_9BACL|nr:hypothetical protein [Paenibacillus forsythiae]MDT3426071.1 hypothetical protein [Paenibacillus forsythiae]